MSSPTPSSRLKVTGLFKAAYRWLCDEPAPAPLVTTPPPAAATKGSSTRSSRLPGAPSTPPAQPRPAANGGVVHLPLQPILDTLPAELKARLRRQTVGAITIAIPLAKIMDELPKGAVRMSFGELRQAAPGVFLSTTDRDQAVISLPLGEILSRVDLTKLAPRNSQKTVEIPEEVTSPFDQRGKGLILSAPPGRPSGGTTSFVPAGSAQHSGVCLPPTGLHREVTPGKSFPSPSVPRSVTPAVPAKPLGPVLPSAHPPCPSPTTSSPPAPLPPPTPVLSPRFAGGNGQSASPPPAPPPAPTAPAAPTASPSQATRSPADNCVKIPVLNVMNGWPQAVRLEIAQLNLMDAKVVVPVTMLEKGLCHGKVEFPWKLVRAWIRPEVPPQSSANDAAPLELPLNVVAPLFIAQRQSAVAPRRRVAVDETIPNLFFGFPQGEAGPGAINASPVSAPVAARPPDTNFFTWGDYAEERPIEERQPAAPVTSNTELLRRQITPHEIVARALGLDGVEGALVALPDGLAVAARVPPSFNSDTLAAFLPQIFTNVSQCTKELRMGSLNNLNFTVGNVPWKIFRVNNVFFAAFGRAEEPLPTGRLAALAAELDSKQKTA